MPLINIHTHHPSGEGNQVEIENLFYPQLPSGASALLSAGLHPWRLDGIDWNDAEKWLYGLTARHGTVAVGEAGLDKACKTPWEVQMKAFRLCIRLAKERGKPLIIHCVRAYDEVLAELRPTGLSAVFHGFDKHPATARMLLRAGCYLSFGAALLRENSRAAAAFLETPDNRFFLETDDKTVAIAAVYKKAARIKRLSNAALGKLVRQNFTTLFGAIPG